MSNDIKSPILHLLINILMRDFNDSGSGLYLPPLLKKYKLDPYHAPDIPPQASGLGSVSMSNIILTNTSNAKIEKADVQDQTPDQSTIQGTATITTDINTTGNLTVINKEGFTLNGTIELNIAKPVGVDSTILLLSDGNNLKAEVQSITLNIDTKQFSITDVKPAVLKVEITKHQQDYENQMIKFFQSSLDSQKQSLSNALTEAIGKIL